MALVPHRRTIPAARQRARADQRQGAGVASAAVARCQRRHRLLPRTVADLRRDGICRPADPRSLRRQRSRLRRSRRGDGGDWPYPDAVAVSLDRRAGGVRAVARRQCRAAVASICRRYRTARCSPRLRSTRGEASAAADHAAGGAVRQRLQALRRQGLCGRRPHRRSLDRGGPHRRQRRRARWPDAVPGRSQEHGASTIERTAMVNSHNAARIVFDHVEVNADGVLGEVDQAAACWRACSISAAARWPRKWSASSEEVFARTVAYLKERKQFGKLIGEFQALQHRAAAALHRDRDHPRRGAEGAADPR